ncbi:class E sortase [Nocardioides sp. Kera G14]|uniref:class E sortase n=1 Tax=Nocardioides sp. Kera G14 TaxID=2884264 RepID=UPI001D10C19D|nr:class E sortase [Nocardioides sp. Kera G14]UDY23608.1 class E sortase [Nocardioides sp. Kera G14]
MTTQPARVRRRSPRRARRGPLFWPGAILVAAGVGIMVWLAWQFWVTNWLSHHRQQEVTSELHRGWQGGSDRVHTDFGTAIAILHIPRFGDDFAVPVLEGDSAGVLAAGTGHLPGTALPGAVGNFVVAGHRVTHGEPFADFPDLRAHDKVYVETRTTTYIYELENSGRSLVVPFTATWVADPSPVNPSGGMQPTGVGDRLLTLFTCSELFHTDNRSVVFGHLVGTSHAVAH